MTDLDILLGKLKTATSPEDVFGANETELRDVYRQLVKIAHPDHNRFQLAEAEEAFRLLGQMLAFAESKIKAGAYGRAITVSSKNGVYSLGGLIATGDIADVFRCTTPSGVGVFKVVREPAWNDAMAIEISSLKKIASDVRAKKLYGLFPDALDSFLVAGRRAAVFQHRPGFVGLVEVREAYADGLDGRHVAWLWKRLLMALGLAHAAGIVHGAVLPPHILLSPDDHGIQLLDWTASVQGGPLKIMSTGFEDWYPPEVTAKRPAFSGTDLYMAAKCMVFAAGGNVKTGATPDSVPRKMKGLLRACLIEAPRYRPQDAWGLHGEIDGVLRDVYGPNKFIELRWPKE